MDETDVLNDVFDSVFVDYKTRLNTYTSVVDDLRNRLSEVDTKDVNEWMQEQEEKIIKRQIRQEVQIPKKG